MMYIKFSSKDTTAIINATDKLINCNPVKSVKVKSIPPELRDCEGTAKEYGIYGI